MAVINTTALNPAPAAVAYDPLGRDLSEAQKIRLREQAEPPLEEAAASERVDERRDDDERQRERQQRQQQRQQDPDDRGPGRFIDTEA